MADRGGAARGGFGSRGDRGGDRGRGRGRRGPRRGGQKSEEKEWQPVTKLGRLVKAGKIKSMEEIYLHSLPIKEYQIVDFFLPKLKDEVMKYGMRALLINEFTAPRWQQAYPTDPSQNLGQALLYVFNFPLDYWWVWLGVGVMIFYIIFFNVVCIVAHKLLPPFGVQASVMSEESLRERELTKKGNFAKAGEVAVNMPTQARGLLCCNEIPDAIIMDDSARQHALANFSSKRLRSGLHQHQAAGGTASAAEEGAAGNGPSPVGSQQGATHRDELNPRTSVNGTREAWPRSSQRDPEAGEEEEEENNLDSSMGIGPVSHRSLASSGLAAATDAAAVSQKSLRAAH
ncbi:MAG: hypothetical protein Q9197_005665, partial [Variospora fuerteventurae]